MSTHIKIATNERGTAVPSVSDGAYLSASPTAASKKSKPASQSTAQTTDKSNISTAKQSLNTPHPTTLTRITVRYNVGFGNTLYLRGDGDGLSWQRGVAMRNTDANTWIWECTHPSFQRCSFKVLINDQQYEIGDNRTLACHAQVEYTPRF